MWTIIILIIGILIIATLFDKREKSKKERAQASYRKETEENKFNTSPIVLDYKMNNLGSHRNRNSSTDSFSSTNLTEEEITNCISNSVFRHISINSGDESIIEFLPNGIWKSKTKQKDGSTRPNTSGKWSIVDQNVIKREFDPNYSNIAESYNQIISCNRIQVGRTPYFKVK